MKKIAIFSVLIGILWQSPVWAKDDDAVNIHGFISQGYIESTKNSYFKDTKDGTFEYDEMGINFVTKLTKRLRLGTQLFARDLGDIGNDRIVIDWAYADYHYDQYLGLRVGKMKSPMGLYNESRDVDLLRTSVLLPQSVYYEALRDSMLAVNGVGLYGDLDLSMFGTLSYLALDGGANISNDGGTAQGVIALGEVNAVDRIDVNSMYAYSLKWSTFIPGFTLAVSQTTIDLETYGDYAFIPGVQIKLAYNDFNTFVYSAEYVWKDLIIAAELNRMFIDYTGEAVGISGTAESGTEKLGGYYGSVGYRFLDWLESQVIYSEWFDNFDDRDGDDRVASGQKRHAAWQKDWTLAFRFDINDNWLFKTEVHFIDGSNLVLRQYMDEEDERYWNMLVVKMTYSF